MEKKWVWEGVGEKGEKTAVGMYCMREKETKKKEKSYYSDGAVFIYGLVFPTGFNILSLLSTFSVLLCDM